MRDETIPRLPGREALATAQRLFILLAISLAVAVLGAKRFAAAAGVNPRQDEPIVLCGIVLGLLTLAVLMSLLHLGRQVVGVLARSPARPGPTVGLALIIGGTVCVLAALGVQLYESGRAVSGTTTLSVPAVGGSARVDAQASDASVVAPVIPVAVLVAGAALVALGIWSSSVPRGLPDSAPAAHHDSRLSASAHVTMPTGHGPQQHEGGDPAR
jgi:hypothetical protein